MKGLWKCMFSSQQWATGIWLGMARLALYGEPKIDCIIWTSQTDNHGEPWISLETWAGQGWVTIPVGTGDKNGIKANPQEASISGAFFLKSFIQVIVFGHSMHLGGFPCGPSQGCYRVLGRRPYQAWRARSTWREPMPLGIDGFFPCSVDRHDQPVDVLLLPLIHLDPSVFQHRQWKTSSCSWLIVLIVDGLKTSTVIYDMPRFGPKKTNNLRLRHLGLDVFPSRAPAIATRGSSNMFQLLGERSRMDTPVQAAILAHCQIHRTTRIIWLHIQVPCTYFNIFQSYTHKIHAMISVRSLQYWQFMESAWGLRYASLLQNGLDPILYTIHGSSAKLSLKTPISAGVRSSLSCRRSNGTLPTQLGHGEVEGGRGFIFINMTI